MPDFLNGSLIARLILSVCHVFANAYGTSRFKRFVDKCGNCARQSTVYKLLSRYINKRAYFEYSLTHRLILRVIRMLDRPIGAVGGFFKYLASGSNIKESADELARSSVRSRLEIAGVIGSMLALGYASGIILRGCTGDDFIPPIILSGTAIAVCIMSYLSVWLSTALYTGL